MSTIILIVSYIFILSKEEDIPIPPPRNYYSPLPKNYNILSWELSYKKAKKFIQSLPLNYKIKITY